MAMCWMAWMPPGAGRDAMTLRAFVDQLMAHAADNPAGAGAAWIVPGAVNQTAVLRALRPNLGAMVQHLVGRPVGAWGVFHARRAPVGNRASKWCHPHHVHHRHAQIVLTYNGIARLCLDAVEAPLLKAWAEAHAMPLNPMLVPAAIELLGLDAAARYGLPNTVIAYEEERDADQASFRIRCWRKLERFPLYRLRNGAVASEGGVGEFESAGAIPLGMTELDPEDGLPNRQEVLAVAVAEVVRTAWGADADEAD